MDHQIYLRFPIPNYATPYLLNDLMKWGERIQNSQTVGPMKRSRCEWDWTLSYRLVLRSMSDLLSYLEDCDRNRERPDLWPVR